MRKLHDLQADFAASIHDTHKPVPEDIARDNGMLPKKRFAVYRNNVYVSLIEALGRQFPVVKRLVGEEFFRALARTYVESNLPKSPLMFQYGDNFADFLEDFDKVEDLPYLADVARIDYARTRSYHAADAAPLTLQELAQIPQDDFAEAHFALHPSLHVIRSSFPVFSIWKANVEEGEVPEINLDQGAQDVMVIRPALTVEAHLLAPGAAEFLLALRDDKNISEAAEVAIEASPEFDFAVLLPQLARAGIFTNHQIDTTE